MFEAHGWIELVGSAAESETVAEKVVRMNQPGSEWNNGLLVAFWSNGHRFVHLGRLWNHRQVGETALEDLRRVLGSEARGRIDVIYRDDLRSEVWWLEGGEFERQPGEDSTIRSWLE